MKKYHLDQNEVGYLHCVNSAFAGISYAIEMLGDAKGITKKNLLKTISNTLAQANTAICSEYIRGELIKKGVIDNDQNLLCTFDPSEDNDKKAETEVYTLDELNAIRSQANNTEKNAL